MKVLFIRFSSIGDIVLTFPVVTALKEKFPDAHVSYLSKDSFIQLLSANKDIDESHAYNGSVRDTRSWISNQKFDIINLKTITIIMYYYGYIS